MKKEQAKNDEKLGKEPIIRLMLSMGIPTLIAQLINVFYNIVDRSYIGHIKGVGGTALTGVGVALPIIIIVSAFSAFVGGGGAPLAAISLGKGDRKRAEKILGNGVTMLLALSIILMFLFYVVKKPFLFAVGASDVTFPYANDYITIYLLGTIFVQITIGLNTFITAQGNSGTAMISVLIGAILNIILDPVFIFALDMGVKGAAVATIISQACSAVWTVHFLLSRKASLKIRLSAMKPDVSVLKSIAALGISPFIMQSTEALISIVMNSGLSHYGGDLYVGALTIMQSVVQLITVPANGFSQGVQPIISYNYGAGKADRVKKTFRYLIFLEGSFCAVLTLVAIFAPGVYAGMFTSDMQLLSLVKKVMPMFVFGMTVFGIQMACQCTFMALGQAKISLFVAALRKIILLAPLAYVLPRITGNVMSIYMAEPISDCISVTVCATLLALNFNKILNQKV